MSINHYAFVRLTDEQTEALARGEPIKVTATDDYGQNQIEFTINDYFGFLDQHVPDLTLTSITAKPRCGDCYVSCGSDWWRLNIVGSRDVEAIAPHYRAPTPEEAAAVPFGERIRNELMRMGWNKSPRNRLLFELFDFLRENHGPKKEVA